MIQMTNDLISRQDAIAEINVLYQEHRYKIPGKMETYSQYNEAWQDALCRAENAIFNLPSAQPEPKTGKWIRHDEVRNVYGGTYVECSECGEKYVVQHIEDEKYCRNCGADMRGEQ